MLSVKVSDLVSNDCSKLLYGLVVPRPIAWISTISPDGTANLAAHSFFNIVSANPPIIMFSSTHSSCFSSDGSKDTLINTLNTQEFVINFAGCEQMGKIVDTSAAYPPEIDEFDQHDIGKLPSSLVRPPRVAGAKAAMECTLHSTLQIGDATVVFGSVVMFHIQNEMLLNGVPNPETLRPLSRLGGPYYAELQKLFKLLDDR